MQGTSSSQQRTPAIPVQANHRQADGCRRRQTAGDDEFAGTIEIIPDEANNAIVFKASSRDYKRVLTVLKQLDIQPRQVLINVLVAEITLSGSVSYGIEWFLNKNIGSLPVRRRLYRSGGLDSKQSVQTHKHAAGNRQRLFFKRL